MFDLEQAIAAWRRQMAAGGIVTTEVLDELEVHIRQDYAACLSAGATETAAFQSAVQHLGEAGSIQAEFDKAGCSPGFLIATLWGIWIGMMILLAAGVLTEGFAGKFTPLLVAHVLALTAGYCTVLLAGGLAMLHIGGRRFAKLTPVLGRSLTEMVLRLYRFSAVLVGAGLLLGMLWARQNWGNYAFGNLREVGAFGALAWLLATLALRHFGQASSDQVAILLCIGGSLVTGLAWFGTGILAHGVRNSGWGTLAILGALAGIHLLFLAMGLAPAPSNRPATS